MQKHPHPSRKSVWFLLLGLCCIVTIVVSIYADFSTSGHVKRVVAVQTGKTTEEVRFSSNYLTSGGSQSGNRIVSVTDTNADAVIGITVCNYPQNDSLLFNQSDIKYTISCAVEGETGTGSGIKLANSGVNILYGNKKSHILHTLTIPKSELNKIVTVTATPDAGSGLPMLSAKLQIVTTAAVQQVGWTGSVTGDDKDALNYQISGTQKGTLTLSWNSAVVSLSKWSAESLGVKDASSTITINVGGAGNPTSYLLQFYWVKGPQNVDEAKLSCSFTGSSVQQPGGD